MNLHGEKKKVQQEALDALMLNGGRGLIAMATGSGKSKVAIDYLKKNVKKEDKILLIVPTEKLRDRDWEEEFSKWNGKRIYKRIDRECYASIKKIKNLKYDYVIADEVQFLTPNNADFFKNNQIGNIIGLSATPPHEPEKREILERLGIHVVYNLSLDEAVRRKIVAPFKIILISISLNDRTKYVKAGTKKKPFYITEQKQYEYLTSRIDALVQQRAPYERVKFLRLARMRFIYNLESKLMVTEDLLNSIPENERTLIYGSNIKSAERLEAHTYHSKSTNVDFDEFVNERINRLSAVQSLNVGVNIPNLDNAVIHQVQSKERHLIQRIGRIVRWRKNHKANIYIVYAKDTVDEDWVKNAIININESNIKHISYKYNY